MGADNGKEEVSHSRESATFVVKVFYVILSIL
jgi:hypothetical protein